MKPYRALGSIAIVLVFLCQNGSSTLLATTLGMGFMGGFLVGKITLGTFLAVISQLSRPQTIGTVTAPAKVSTRFNEITGGIEGIPNSMDNQVRDKFLRQLGKMDPLNCLPKVFCEISADPEAASNLFGQESLPFASNLNANGDDLQSSKIKPKTKKTKKPIPSQNDDEQDESQNDDDTSDSQSDEDEPEEDEEEAMFKKYQEKEAYNIESKALDDMIDEFDNPVNYYFILKDKKKNIHPDLYDIIKNGESHRSLVSNSEPSSISKRLLGQTPDFPIESVAATQRKTSSRGKGSSSTPIDDIFADDPFFDDFSRSLKFTTADETNERLSNVAQLRRSKREVIDEDGIIVQYRMAARVAERYKDPSKCRKVFSTCPFSTEEVMTMVNEMNSHKDANKKKKNGSMKNLKNTLLAIEKLNNATLLAKSSGIAIDYGKVMNEAIKKTEGTGASATSTKIIEDFEEYTDQIQNKNSKLIYTIKKTKKSKPGATKKKQSVRRRRHGIMSPEMEMSNLNTVESRAPRISLSGSRVEKSDNPEIDLISVPKLDLQTVPVSKPIQENIKSEEMSSTEPKAVHNLGAIVADTPLQLPSDAIKDPEFRVYKSDETEEDDEATFVGSQSPSKVPTFSQTYVETLQSPTKIRTRPRPVYPLVKVKPYIKRTTTPSSKIPTTTVRSRRPAQQITQKFSGELEDDEEEAKNTEDAIEVLISKYKPKDKKSKP